MALSGTALCATMVSVVRKVELPENYVVFDLETTGYTPKNAEIIEIGAIRCLGGEPYLRFRTFVCPQSAIPPFITNLTGITNEMVCTAPPWQEAVRVFLSFAGDLPVVGHNVRFDLSFMRHYASAMGETFDPPFYDTLPLARRTFKTSPNKPENFKLETLKRFLGLSFTSHRALSDCEVTQYLFEYCRKKPG